MKNYMTPVFVLLAFFTFGTGCQDQVAKAQSEQKPLATTQQVQTRVVEAACGECQFGLKGDGCNLAIRIDKNAYFVDGTKIGDHGDAHAKDGFCNEVRKARVQGLIQNGRFVSKSFKLLP